MKLKTTTAPKRLADSVRRLLIRDHGRFYVRNDVRRIHLDDDGTRGALRFDLSYGEESGESPSLSELRDVTQDVAHYLMAYHPRASFSPSLDWWVDGAGEGREGYDPYRVVISIDLYGDEN